MPQRRKTHVSFSLAAAVALLTFTSCTRSDPVATETPRTDTPVVSSIPPFQTKEPQRYRATRTITTITADGKTVVTKSWIARDGELRRNESETGSQRVVYLSLAEGIFVLLPAEKLFAELTNDESTATEEEESGTSPDRLLHVEPIATSYQRLGTETIGGRNTEKYRVVVNSPDNANVSVSETLIWIDEALQMPIKSEMTSAKGTRVITELFDIELDVSKDTLKVPGDYKRVAFDELRKRLRLSQP